VTPIDTDATSARAFVAVAYRRDADADVADVTPTPTSPTSPPLPSPHVGVVA